MRKVTSILILMLLLAISTWGQIPGPNLNEGFEGGVIPENWTVINADGGTVVWAAQASNPNTGTYCASVQYESFFLANDDWLITPPLWVTSAMTDEISFWLRTYSAFNADPWEVLVSTTDTNPASFTVIDNGPGNLGAYVQKTYSLDAYGDAVVYVAIRYTGLNQNSVYIDDFVGPPVMVPTCPKPTNLTATNLTTTSGDLGWTPGNTETMWNIEWGNVGFTQGIGTMVTGVTANPYTLGGLSPVTNYSYYVQSDCGTDEVSDWAGPYSFWTIADPLSGSYTINSTLPTEGTNFNNFTDFATTMNFGGFAGPVVVDVVTGTGPYEEQVILGELPNSSDVNTLTINGNGETLQYLSTNSNERATLKFNGTDYVTVNDLTIKALGEITGEYGFAVHLMNLADHNSFFGCQFMASTSITSINFAAFATSNYADGANLSSLAVNYLTVDNCTTIGGYYGMIVNGPSAPLYAEGNVITNNTIKDFHQYGLYLRGQSNGVFANNEISRPTRTTTGTLYMLYLTQNMSGSLINGNHVFDLSPAAVSATTAHGIYGTSVSADAGNELLITNNIVHGFGNMNGIQYGIYLGTSASSGNTRIYHNTLALDNINHTGSSTIRVIYHTGANATGIDIKNNIISLLSNTTGAKHCLYFATNTAVITTNYNVLDLRTTAGTTHVGYFNGSNYTFVAWKNSGRDVNSKKIDPLYIDLFRGNLMPQAATIDNMGTNLLAIVPEDFYGVTRTTTPDPGSIEFLPATCLAPSGLNLTGAASDMGTIGWTANSGETMWNLEWGLSGYTFGSGNLLSGITEKPYTITGLTPETFYDVYLQADCGTDETSSWIGPFTFTTTQACLPPTDFSVIDLAANTATLIWTAGGYETLWNIEWGPEGFVQGSGTLVTSVNNPSYELTGLTSQTSYDVYAQSSCGTDTSPWVGPFNFTTLCVSFDLPFEEDFTDANTATIPDCWEVQGLGLTNWGATATANAGGISPEITFSYTPSFTGLSMLVSPPINTAGETIMLIDFKHFLDYYDVPYTIGLKTTGDGVNWHTVWSIDPTANVGPESQSILVTAAEGVGSDHFRFAFFGNGYSYNMDYWYIDDVIAFSPRYGILSGYVTEATRGPVENARVFSGEYEGFTDTTGFYEIENVLTGIYDFTCEAESYFPKVAEGVEILTGVTTTLNFELGFAQIAVDPEIIQETMLPGQVMTKNLSISNPMGTESLTWSADISLPGSKAVTGTKPLIFGEPINVSNNNPSMDICETTAYIKSEVTDAAFNILQSFSVSAGGEQAIGTDGKNIYTAFWSSPGLFGKYNLDGTFIETFTIAGVSGIRDFAYDGTYFYGGAAANILYTIDLSHKNLVAAMATPVAVRHCAYDPVNDGFWIGNWNDLTLIDRTGAILHNGPDVVTVYGSAYDGVTPGGPYLWLFAQVACGANEYNRITIQQFDIAANNFTGVTHCADDLPGLIQGNATLQTNAGGAMATDLLIPGKFVLMVNVQQTPNLIGVYELAILNPWITLSDYNGVVGPGESQVVDVILDATGLTDNTYYLNININHNGQMDAQSTLTVPVEMTVASNLPPVVATLISPANNATLVSLQPVFEWINGAGTNFNRLQITTGTPPFTQEVFISDWFLGETFDLSTTAKTLDPKENYNWQITSMNETGTTHSAIWKFTTIGIGTIQGIVTDAYTGQPMQGVTITAEEWRYSTETGADGTYSLEGVVEGAYEVTASFLLYVDQTIETVVVHNGNSIVNFELNHFLAPPLSLQAQITNVFDVELTWNAPTGETDDFFDLLSYNIYKDGEFLANTTETEYDDLGLDGGTYYYTVTAVYDEGESEPAGPAGVVILAPPMLLSAEPDFYGVELVWEDGSTVPEVEVSELEILQKEPQKGVYDQSLYPDMTRQGGDDIASAFDIASLPFTVTGATTGYTNIYDEACPYAGGTAPDVVYSFTPAENMLVNIDLCGSSYDTKIFVYENEHTPGNPFACNDDFYGVGNPCGSSVSALFDLILYGGNTYYIVIDGNGSSNGNYILTMNGEPIFLVSYNVYRNSVQIAETYNQTYYDQDIVNGEEYCYTVSQMVAPELETGLSNELCPTVPLIPEISANPTELFKSLGVGETDTETLSVLNTGTGVLEFEVNVQVTTDAPISRFVAPESYNPDSYIKCSLLEPMDAGIECPEGSIISQPAIDFLTAYNADEDFGYSEFQSFSGGGNLGGLRFWTISGYFDGIAWGPCTGIDPRPFTIGFYNDDAGQPGTLVNSFLLDLTRVNTGLFALNYYPIYEYTAIFPSNVSMTSGWFSIQSMTGTAVNCWNLVLNQPGGLGQCLQWDGTAYTAQPAPLGFCMIGADETPWLTVTPMSGTINGVGQIDLDVTFDATTLDPGYYYADILVNSNDPDMPQVVVPVELVVGLTQNVELNTGWSGWSSYIDPMTDDAFADVVAPVISNMIITQHFSNLFYPAYGINTMGDFSNAHGYLSKMSAEAVLTVTGMMANPTVELNAGWNLFPVIAECNLSVANVFGQIPGLIIAYEVAGNGIYYPAGSVFTLETVVPGAAYWVKVSGTTSFTFPPCAKEASSIWIAPLRHANTAHWNDVSYTGISHIVVFDENTTTGLMNGDLIGAFTNDGTCAGMTVVNGKTASLALFGDDITTAAIDGFTEGEQLTFKVYRHANETEYLLEVIYSALAPNYDGTYAASGTSVINDMTMTTTGIGSGELCGLSIYPNPSQGNFNVAIDNNLSKNINYTVTNAKGQAITSGKLTESQIIDLSSQPKGIYLIRFTGDNVLRIEKLVIK